jgi:Cu2+-exporting ATPase/Cu+-exporting ATPase
MYFFVEGVHCTACLWRVESVQEEFEGVLEVRLDMGRHVVEVEAEPGVPLAPLAASLEKRGYKPHPIPHESLVEQSGGGGHKSLLIKMGVAGAAAGNIMLLSTSLYSGAQHSQYATIFEWLTFALFLPILLYSATPFYKNSWIALRNRHSSIDIPIVGAVLIGTGLGLYHLIVGRGSIYFDSLAVLVFLLLASRYFLFRLQNKFLAPNRLRSFFESDKVRVVDPETGKAEFRHIRSIRKGDRVLVYQGERIPVDGLLSGAEAYVNAAVLTGEPYPRRVLDGQELFAGTQLTSSEALVIVERCGDETRVGQLLQETERHVLGRTPLISFTDRAAQWFSASALAVGLLFAVLYGLTDIREAIDRALALVILACPCALALATPLTQSLALRKVARRGCLVKNAESFEKLCGVEDVFLDKTGTLTEGELTVEHWWPAPPSARERSIIYALESISRHPIARVLSSEVSREPCDPLHLDDHREIPGTGVTGRYGGNRYEIRSLTDPSVLERADIEPGDVRGGYSFAAFYKNGDFAKVAVLGDRIRETSAATVAAIEKRGKRVYLLTGDGDGPARAVATRVGIPDENVLASQSPEDKQKIIEAHPKSLMVGDGVNDSVALANAGVGVAVHGSMEVSFRAADIYLTQPGLQPLAQLLELSQTTIYIIKRNLLISLLYNAAGATLALLGYISPLVAAVLMPISSATVVSLSVIGTRFWRRYDRDPAGVPAGAPPVTPDSAVPSPATGGGV